jgi:predicted house-cleaning noncanonical NTP pyrophosphatase (MazG superfamily)
MVDDINQQITDQPVSQDNQSTDTAQLAPIPDEVREYLDSLLQDAGMSGFDPAMHDAMINELYIRLDKFLIGKVVEFLPEDKLEEFAKLNEETADPAKIQEYLTANLQNAQDVFTTAFGEFRDIYLEGVKQAVQNQDNSAPVAQN